MVLSVIWAKKKKKKVRWKEAHNKILSKNNTSYIIIADIH